MEQVDTVNGVVEGTLGVTPQTLDALQNIQLKELLYASIQNLHGHLPSALYLAMLSPDVMVPFSLLEGEDLDACPCVWHMPVFIIHIATQGVKAFSIQY